MRYYEEQIELDSSIPARIYIQRGENQNKYPLHWHNNLEFDLVLKGQIRGKINGKEVIANAGDIFFVNSGELHETDADSTLKIEAITVLLSKKLLKEYCPDIDLYYFDISNDSAKSEIREIILRCAAVFEAKEAFYELELSAELRRLCLVLLRNCMKERVEAGVGKFRQESLKNVKKAIAYMEKNFDTQFTLADIAAEIGMAPTYFSRFFKKCTGENFYSYLNSIRLFNAQNDLLNGDDSITDIALNNGFANVKSFIEMFKKKHGITPAKYRKLHQ